MTAVRVQRVAAVVLGFGDEPLLDDCIQSLLKEPLHTVLLVDNGIIAAHDLPKDRRLRTIGDGTNVGFAAGCNLAASFLAGDHDVLLFVNSDLVVERGAVVHLLKELEDPKVGLVSGLVVLHDRPDVINSAGNPVHYSLMSWAGSFGDSAVGASDTVDVASASGALMAIRASDWLGHDGLHSTLFAYGEDVDLSIRVWQSGQAVRCVAAARGRHRYNFIGSRTKWFLLERNRLINLLTLLEGQTLVTLLPGLVVVEAGVLATAFLNGWLRLKLSGYRWLWRNRGMLRERRRWVQSRRQVPDRALGRVFVDTISPGPATGVRVPGILNRYLAVWGRVTFGGTSRLLPRGRDTGAPPDTRIPDGIRGGVQ